MTPSPKKDVKEFTGRKALMWIVGFFLTIFSVNAIMATIAVGTWGGLETKNAYRKGIHYNDEIAAAEVQKKSGWEISLKHSPGARQAGRLDVEIIWPQNDLPPANVTAIITRAVTNAYDQEVILTKTGSNIYTAPINLPQPGQWNVNILVKTADGPIYQLVDKIFIDAEK